MEELKEQNVYFMDPFVSFLNEEVATKELVKVFTKEFKMTSSEVKEACHLAWEEMMNCRHDIQKKVKKHSVTLKKQEEKELFLQAVHTM